MRNATYLSTVQVYCQRNEIPEIQELLFLSPSKGKPVQDFPKRFDAHLASFLTGHPHPQVYGSDVSWQLHQWGCRQLVGMRSYTVDEPQHGVSDSVVLSLELETAGGFPHGWVADLSALLPDSLLELTFRSTEGACAGFWEFKEGKLLAGYMDDSWNGSDFDGRAILQTNRDTDEFARNLVAQTKILNSK